MKIILASHNMGKVAEINASFSDLPITLVPQNEYGIDEVEENGATFIENALIKARHAANLTGLPAIADDSGLVVPALNGEPGIYSARYAGASKNNGENIQKLLHRLKEVSRDKRQAVMHCSVVFLRSADDAIPLIAEANWSGEIIDEPKGSNGFGYDPVFWLAHEKKTAAELSLEAKNQQSHRYIALKILKKLMVEALCMPCLSKS